MGILVDLRKRLRRWLGIAAIQRQIRDLEDKMAVSSVDLERLNAATSRIAARVAAMLDQIDALGTGNDDAVRDQAQLESVQQASADLRPIIEQLEALGADAAEVVPEPAPEQVPVEPGPDVAPVENLPEAPAPGGGTVVTEPAPAPGHTDPDGATDDPSEVPADVPAEDRPREQA